MQTGFLWPCLPLSLPFKHHFPTKSFPSCAQMQLYPKQEERRDSGASKWKRRYCVARVLSHVRLFATPGTVTPQAPLSMGFPRQEFWSGLPFPTPGDLPTPGVEPRSPPLQADSLPAKPQGKLKNTGVGSLSLLQSIFPTQESNWGLLCLLHFQADSLPLCHLWIPRLKVKVAQLCPILCDPMDYRVHVILQARILEWVLSPSPEDLPNPGTELRSPTLQADSLPAEPQSPKPTPSPGDLPDPGIEPESPALEADSLPIELSGKTTLDVSQKAIYFIWRLCIQ